MIPIDQTISDPQYGNCTQACVASILEVPMEAVPNFSYAPDGLFHHLFEQTMFAYGWVLDSNAIHDGVLPWRDKSINGFYLCSVPSKTFDCAHSVIIDEDGIVVHDPNPNKLYQGECLFREPRVEGSIRLYNSFHTFDPRSDEMWKDIQKCVKHHALKRQSCRGAFDKTVNKCQDGE